MVTSTPQAGTGQIAGDMPVGTGNVDVGQVPNDEVNVLATKYVHLRERQNKIKELGALVEASVKRTGEELVFALTQRGWTQIAGVHTKGAKKGAKWKVQTQVDVGYKLDSNLDANTMSVLKEFGLDVLAKPTIHAGTFKKAVKEVLDGWEPDTDFDVGHFAIIFLFIDFILIRACHLFIYFLFFLHLFLNVFLLYIFFFNFI